MAAGQDQARSGRGPRRRLRAAIPGATLNFTQPIIDTVTEIVTGSSADLAVIISGPDLKMLRELATGR